MSSIYKPIPIFLAALLIAACGGKAAKQTADAEAKSTEDITRPPVFVKEVDKPAVESNPDETISYDEWRKRREDEQRQADESTDAPVELEEPEEPEEPTKIP